MKYCTGDVWVVQLPWSERNGAANWLYDGLWLTLPLVANPQCPLPWFDGTSVDGYTTKLCIFVVVVIMLFMCGCENVHRGWSCPRELRSPRARDASNIRKTARGTLDQPAKIVKFDLTRCAPPHYSFKRAAACVLMALFSLFRFDSKFKHFFRFITRSNIQFGCQLNSYI